MGADKQDLDGVRGGGGGACLSHADDSSAPARQSPASDALLATLTLYADATASLASDWSHPHPELHNPPRSRALESGTLETGASALSTERLPTICRTLDSALASTPPSGPSGWRELVRLNGELPPLSLSGRLLTRRTGRSAIAPDNSGSRV